MDWVHPKLSTFIIQGKRSIVCDSGQMDGWMMTDWKYRIDVSTQCQKYFLGSFLSVHRRSESGRMRMRQSGHSMRREVTLIKWVRVRHLCIKSRVGEILCTYTVIQVSLTTRRLRGRRAWTSRLIAILTWNGRKEERQNVNDQKNCHFDQYLIEFLFMQNLSMGMSFFLRIADWFDTGEYTKLCLINLSLSR